MKKPLFNKICIVGVGLIGGSLGLAVKKRRLAKWVIGVSRKDSTLKEAVSLKAIDVGTKNLKEAVQDADLIILCTPVYTIIEQLKTIRLFLKKGVLVIDTGSSKFEIQKVADKHLPRNVFIGCHPMAGSEKTGVENACPDIFENAVCFATKNHPAVKKFWLALGAKFIVTEAKTHDAWVAKASHLPHLLSFALFQSLKFNRQFSANPSVKSLVRLSQSDASLWSEIFLSNQHEISLALRQLQKNISKFQGALRSKHKLHELISRANQNSLTGRRA